MTTSTYGLHLCRGGGHFDAKCEDCQRFAGSTKPHVRVKVNTLRGKKLEVWRCIVRRLAGDTDWWAGFPGLQYGRAAIDDLAVACARWMDKWWDGPDQMKRWEVNAAATRIMNAAAISLAGTCDMHCRAGHTLDCEIRRIDLANLPAHEVLSDDANERALAAINSEMEQG